MAVLYAGAEWVGCHPENFRVGRTDYNPPYQTFPVLAIALHHTGATFQQTIDTFLAAPASGKNHSAHFAARNADGYRVQFVDTDNTAFALGYSQPNCYTVNIECEQTWDYGAGVKTSDFSDVLYQSVGDLVRIVCTDKGVPIDAAHIFGHNHWDTSNTCPADLDIARIIAIAQGGADLPLNQADFDGIERLLDAKLDQRLAEIRAAIWDAAGTPGYAAGTGFLLQEIKKVQSGGGTEPKTLTIPGPITGTLA